MYQLGLVSSISTIIPFLYGLYFKSYKTKELTLFFYYLLTGAFFECLLNYIAITNSHNNHFISNYFSLFESVLLGLMFLKWNKNKLAKIFIVFFLSVFVVSWSYSLFSMGVMAPKQQIWLMLFKKTSLIIISFSFLLHLMLNELNTIKANSQFWISFGVLFYFGVSLILSVTYNLLFKTDTPTWFLLFYAVTQAIANVTGNVFYTIGLCKSRKQI